ncbi:hypothetical protein NVS55_01985 [Myxococcus stipitatus]|uniref:hypothetical protein n=1 Tax=Myxococcus stipitatus TaxID=83455 RepID=UPI003145185B
MKRLGMAMLVVGGVLGCEPGPLDEASPAPDESPVLAREAERGVSALQNPPTPPQGPTDMWGVYTFYSSGTFTGRVGEFRESCGQYGGVLRGETSYFYKHTYGDCQWPGSTTECMAQGVPVPCP